MISRNNCIISSIMGLKKVNDLLAMISLSANNHKHQANTGQGEGVAYTTSTIALQIQFDLFVTFVP